MTAAVIHIAHQVQKLRFIEAKLLVKDKQPARAGTRYSGTVKFHALSILPVW